MGPLLYFYFLSLTNSDFRFKRLIGHTLFYPYPWFLLVLVKFLVDFPFIILLSLERNINLEPKGRPDPHYPVQFIGYMSFLFICVKRCWLIAGIWNMFPGIFHFRKGSVSDGSVRYSMRSVAVS